MSGSSAGVQSKLRETLEKEDTALAERTRAAVTPAAIVSPVATARTVARTARALAVKAGPAVAADEAARLEAERRDKHEKVERDSFSMPASEHKRIKAMREALGKAGVLASKSEVLRAGLALLAERDAAEIARLVAALPKVAKGKRKKH
ncbi:MAG: hypothetical protein ABTQ28_17910 [Thauera sp.]|jgi:Arc/MetJ-type ribon-helix-helix transcriptional regulator